MRTSANWKQVPAHHNHFPPWLLPNFPSPKQYSACLVVTSTLRIWSQFRQRFNLIDFSIDSPTCNNHVFLPAKLDPVFAQWQRAGLYKFSDLYMALLLLLTPFPPKSNRYTQAFSAISRFITVRSISLSFPGHFANSCTQQGSYLKCIYIYKTLLCPLIMYLLRSEQTGAKNLE